MAGFEKFLYGLVVCLAGFHIIADCRELQCYKCSWTGTQEHDEAKTELLDDQRKGQASLSKPIDNPLYNPYIESTVMPDEAKLQECEKCKVVNGFCAKWVFLSNDVPQNATYMCVHSVAGGESGVFEQKMPSGEVKRVLICNNKDLCNSGKAGIRPQVLFLFILPVVCAQLRLGL